MYKLCGYKWSHIPNECACLGYQGDAGMNIKEAHVFNTDDKFSLDVFVADGWESEVCIFWVPKVYVSMLPQYCVVIYHNLQHVKLFNCKCCSRYYKSLVFA